MTEKAVVCFDGCAWDRAASAAVSCKSVPLSSLARLLSCLDRHKLAAALVSPIAALVRAFDSWKRSEELLAVEWEIKPRRPKSGVPCRAPSSLISRCPC